MSFDVSRFSFDAWKDRSGVVMQQGRPQLDSDWNEWMAILNRRIQAGTLDALGRVAVPSTTPYGFKITANQSGTTNSLSIGVGRIYVDGLLVENHGTPTATYDRALAELSNTPQTSPPAPEIDIPFASQPHLPNPTGAFLPGNGPFVIYLDAWQREVTYLQDPDLVERALGVDTTGRLQTVWQVKMLDVSKVQPTGITCTTSLAPWDALVQPSPSRLSSAPFPAPNPGPGSLTSSAGYTGLENQLYRVEIHQAGTFNTAATGTGATFKWSRDNGSVATAVTAITAVGSASQLTVQSTGKDDVLSFHPGDWIEITDDARELAGLTGDLRQIASDGVDPTAKTILLTGAVGSDIATNLTTPPANLGNCHARIQRWDTGNVYLIGGTAAAPTTTIWVPAGGRGDIPVPPKGQSVILENGIAVSFDLAVAGGSFVPGDYWCFATRNDGSLEQLNEAPPRGVHHHYARLAVVTFGNPAANCPLAWPPVTTSANDSCACMVCVELADYLADNTAITNAINKVASLNGGRVCLGAGTFVLGTTPLIMSALAHVTLSGQGAATGLIYSGTGSAVQVSQAWDVRIEDLAVIATYVPPTAGSGVIAGISVQNSLGVTIERCSVLTLDTAAPVAPAPAGLPVDPFQILNTSTQTASGTGIGILLDAFVIAGIFRDNLLISDIGIGSTTVINATLTNPQTNTHNILALDGIEISRNGLNCTMAGVAIGVIGVSTATRACFFLGPTDISDNRVQVSQLMGIALEGYALPDAIVRVARNYVEAPLIGIATLVDGALIEDNLVTQPAVATMAAVYPFATGIGASGPLEIVIPYARASVLRNRVQNWAGAGIGATHLALATVQDNSITNVLVNGIVAVLNVELRVCGNEVIIVSSNPSAPAGTVVTGISVAGAVNALVEGNTVGIIAPAGGVNASGVHVLNVLTASVNGNQVNQIGPITDLSFQPYGIWVENPAPPAPAIPLLLGLTLNNNSVLQFGTSATSMSNFEGLSVTAPAVGSWATVRDNSVAGGSLQPLIVVSLSTTAGDCVLTGNYCNQTATGASISTPIVQVVGAATAVVCNNRITGAGHDTGLSVTTPATSPPTPATPKAAIIGNIVATQILFNGQSSNATPAPPWAVLNVIT
ncbi:DUF6519 domain-containing protein [Bradyrhizobium sp.]|uniref:DUF6519 domain-containing protein n=1 Tax=Bradyrhizobium sp. TaxID=376 RepID=UPI003C31C81D